MCHCAQLRALTAQRGLKVKLTVQSRLPRVHNSTPQIAIRSASHTLPGRWPRGVCADVLATCARQLKAVRAQSQI